MKGAVVLVPFPYTDLSSTKMRPAVILLENENDIVVAFVSSKLPATQNPAAVILMQSDPGFVMTGLKTDSAIKLDKIATIIRTMVAGVIGELPDTARQEVNRKMADLYRI
jgi:mRNA interferase MazF